MKYLTIIRHAKSSWSDMSLSDIDRPLNKRGLKSAPVMGQVLKSRGIQFDSVFTSRARRAHDTIKLICRELDFPATDIKVSEDLYTFGYHDVLEFIYQIDNELNDIAIGGHNPACHSLFFLLTNRNLAKYPTCAVARIKFEINSWSEIAPSKGELVFYEIPRNHLP